MRLFLTFILLLSLSITSKAQWTGGGAPSGLNGSVTTYSKQNAGSASGFLNEGHLMINRSFLRTDLATGFNPGWSAKMGGLSYLNVINSNLPTSRIAIGINYTGLGMEFNSYVNNTSNILFGDDPLFLFGLGVGVGPTISVNPIGRIKVNVGMNIQPSLLVLSDVDAAFLGSRYGFHAQIKYTKSLFTGFEYTWGTIGNIESEFYNSSELQISSRRFEIIILGLAFN